MDDEARAYGYKSFSEGMVVEYKRMYDELMRAYGKDDYAE